MTTLFAFMIAVLRGQSGQAICQLHFGYFFIKSKQHRVSTTYCSAMKPIQEENEYCETPSSVVGL